MPAKASVFVANILYTSIFLLFRRLRRTDADAVAVAVAVAVVVVVAAVVVVVVVVAVVVGGERNRTQVEKKWGTKCQQNTNSPRERESRVAVTFSQELGVIFVDMIMRANIQGTRSKKGENYSFSFRFCKHAVNFSDFAKIAELSSTQTQLLHCIFCRKFSHDFSENFAFFVGIVGIF